MKHGQGIMRLINGDVLEGTFAHDVMEGSDCKITYSNGDYYEETLLLGCRTVKECVGRRVETCIQESLAMVSTTEREL